MNKTKGCLIANFATVPYKSLAMNAEQRYVNPLGFRVTSYRVNPEVN
ncbi:VirB8/TrbF family protein [Phytobacter diazotrophicus]